MVLAGTISMESMGFKMFGFGGGRIDDWEPEMVNWGMEKEFLSDKMHYHGDRKLDKSFAATQMGLIYVNPEGPGGNPDPLLSADEISTTFGRMAMNDEETVALIAGGHTFGKEHGAHMPEECVSSGLEGAWTISPTAWSINYLQNLINLEWVKTKSPAGATQWTPKNANEVKFIPDANIKGKTHAPMMFTTDIALKADPEYRKSVERFLDDQEEFDLAFAKAWFKLTHRDKGPQTHLIGPDVPEAQLWQDPIPAIDYPLVYAKDIKRLEATILDSSLIVPQLVRTAWGSGDRRDSTF
jgi:catalase-peroxidase